MASLVGFFGFGIEEAPRLLVTDDVFFSFFLLFSFDLVVRQKDICVLDCTGYIV